MNRGDLPHFPVDLLIIYIKCVRFLNNCETNSKILIIFSELLLHESEL